MFERILLGAILIVGWSGASVAAEYGLLAQCIAAGAIPESGGTYWVELNPDRDVPICEKAAQLHPENGLVHASLGRLLSNAQECDAVGDEADCRKAENAFQKAADLGIADGYFGLGYLWEDGMGRPYDTEKAIAYYNKSMEIKPLSFAYRKLAELYRDGEQQQYLEHVRQGMASGIASAFGDYGLHLIEEGKPSEGLAHLKRAAESGDVVSLYELGDIYYYGEVVQQDDETAGEYYKRAIDLKSGYAAYSLASMYINGYLPFDEREDVRDLLLNAYKWGDCNDPLSLIGDLYFDDFDGEKPAEFDEAFKWYSKAFEAREVNSGFKLGYMYLTGLGGPVSERLAEEVFQSQFDIEGMSDVQWGQFVRISAQDWPEAAEIALYFFQKAADQGDPNGYRGLAEIFSDRGSEHYDYRFSAHAYLLARHLEGDLHTLLDRTIDLTEDELYPELSASVRRSIRQMMRHMRRLTRSLAEENIEAAVLDYLTTAQPGSSVFDTKAMSPGIAYYDLGSYYHNRDDQRRAYAWWKKCAAVGHQVCLSNMLVMHSKGEGTPKDLTQAEHWLKVAEDEKWDTPLVRVKAGALLETGLMGDKNPARAAVLYKSAAEDGYAEAQSNYGWMLHTGSGVTQDKDEAFDWFLEAAKQGQARGLHMVGRYFEEDAVQKKNMVVARYFLHKAADKGYQPSINRLKELGVGFGSFIPTNLIDNWCIDPSRLSDPSGNMQEICGVVGLLKTDRVALQ